MRCEECIEIIKTICSVITTITAVLGAFFVVLQIRNGSRAQQDKNAPLLVLDNESGKDRIKGIFAKNVGSFSAKIIKINVILQKKNGKRFRLLIDCHKKLSPDECICFDELIGNEEKKRTFNTEDIGYLKMTIKYLSPLNDRVRYCEDEFRRQ